MDRFGDIEASTPPELEKFVDHHLDVLDKIEKLIGEKKISEDVVNKIAKEHSEEELENYFGAHFTSDMLTELNTYLAPEDQLPLL